MYVFAISTNISSRAAVTSIRFLRNFKKYQISFIRLRDLVHYQVSWNSHSHPYHNSGVTWRMKSSANDLIVQRLVQINKKGNIEALLYRPIGRGLHRWSVVPLTNSQYCDKRFYVVTPLMLCWGSFLWVHVRDFSHRFGIRGNGRANLPQQINLKNKINAQLGTTPSNLNQDFVMIKISRENIYHNPDDGDKWNCIAHLINTTVVCTLLKNVGA